MIKRIFFFIAVFGFGALAAQNVNLSPFTRAIVSEFNRFENPEKDIKNPEFIKNYALVQIGDDVYADCFINVSEEFSQTEAEALGMKVNSKFKGIWTVLVPVSQLENVARLKGVKYLEAGLPVKPLLDSARTKSNVNPVHLGTGLEQAYKGTGVIVGIIDQGFDYTHPTFYDNAHSNYRVKRVWEQLTSGTPPSGYSIGTEYTTQTAILARQHDHTNGNHATHVAGIAGGSGGTNNSELKGAAPESDLVFVSTNMQSSGVINGLSYIKSYAQSQNKPCVINMSLGSNYGPNDGMSGFEQVLDQTVGAGCIAVISAGNEGDNNIFATKNQVGTDTMNVIATGTDIGQGYVWGVAGNQFAVEVAICNSSGVFVSHTGFVQTASGGSYSNTISGSGGSCYVQIQTEGANYYNNKPNAYIAINFDNISSGYYAVIRVASNASSGTTTSIWGNSYAFATDVPAGFTAGSTNQTINSIATGYNSISVGAYVSKKSWSTIGGSTYHYPNATNNDIASFSSKGPTADGRIKPNIAAPGQAIVSSYSNYSYDVSDPYSSQMITATETQGGTNWYYGIMRGTSMSAPFATGVIALWLQRDPTLTPANIISLLQDHSTTDSLTGSSLPNNTWGYGKINALAGMQTLEDECPSPGTITITNLTPTSVSFSWNATPATYYDAKVQTNDGAISYSGQNITQTNASDTNLTAGTSYIIVVRSNCENGNYSDWDTLQFSTPLCEAADQCTYKLIAKDSYGDGWNGGYVSIKQNGIEKGQLAATNHNLSYTLTTDTLTISLCGNVSTTIEWNGGNYQEEIGFALIAPNGTNVYNVDIGDVGSSNISYLTNPIATFITNCEVITPIIVTTVAASNITESSATLNGTVTQGQNTVTARGFKYKETSATSWSNVVAVGTTTITSVLTALTSNTNYTFKAYAVASGDTTYGNELSFTTSQIVPPTCTTMVATNVTQTTATLRGYVTQGTHTITVRGFKYKETSATTWTNSVAVGTTTITSALTALNPNTNYTFKAYAVAGGDTTYGDELSFTTLQTIAPTVTTNAATNVTQTTATLNGTVAQGTNTITIRGFKYRLSASADSWSNSVAVGTTTITSIANNLTPNTNYEFKAYAVAGGDTTYGNEQSFTTLSDVPTTVTTNAATNVTQATATLNGTITEGTNPVSARGFKYKITANAAWSDASATGTSVITASLTNLTASTNYTFKAYAVNATDTIFGAENNFTTLNPDAVEPVVNTDSAIAVCSNNQISATFYGTISNLGNIGIDSVGFWYSKEGAITLPTNFSTITASWNGTIGGFSATIGNLDASTTYYVHAFAMSGGNEYSFDEITFTTPACNSLTDIEANVISLSISPNPSSDVATLSVNVPSEAVITINNSLGQFIERMDIKPSQQKILLDVSQFAKGVYYITCNTDCATKTIKFIVNR
ncbi:MAG: S8 family serine peptidase [Bacteroidales bacterium]|jgi:subtilisin family serine protease|nr:S8 family serine peptidase [Bacteroidales bacterium]